MSTRDEVLRMRERAKNNGQKAPNEHREIKGISDGDKGLGEG